MPGILHCRRVAEIIAPFHYLFPQEKGRSGGQQAGSNFGQLVFALGKYLQPYQNSKTEYNNSLKKHMLLDFVLLVGCQTFLLKEAVRTPRERVK